MMAKRSGSETSSSFSGNSLVADLPAGWRREERGGGGGQGRIPVGMGEGSKRGGGGWKSEVVYISPDDRECRSFLQMQSTGSLPPDLDLSFFDFRSGKPLRNEARKLKLKQKEILKEGITFPRRTISSGSILGKISQTVTPVGSHSASDVRVSSTQKVTKRKPRQIFWNKRLSRKLLIQPQTDATDDYSLPEPVKPLLDAPADVVLASIMGCLHSANPDFPVVGQQQNHFKAIQSNPAVWINYSQPIVEKFLVSEEDIKMQEEKVLRLRTQLAHKITPSPQTPPTPN